MVVKEVAEASKRFLERNYIVVATGCGAMSIGEYTDDEGKPYMKDTVGF